MDRETLTEEQRHAVDQIGRAGRHLLGMTDEVLDIARIEAGALALTVKTVELEPLILEAVALIEPQGPGGGDRGAGGRGVGRSGPSRSARSPSNSP